MTQATARSKTLFLTSSLILGGVLGISSQVFALPDSDNTEIAKINTTEQGSTLAQVARPGLNQPKLPRHHPDFICPPKLRARVDFWKDIFTKYGRHQLVIHHREFPQLTFGVIDLSAEAQTLNPVEFERFKKRAVGERVAQVEAAFKKLAMGALAETELERLVVTRMQVLPGGPEKYERAVKEDLIRTQTGIREKYGEAVKRAGRYVPIMEKIFRDEFGLPIELTRLPFVESSFDYKAYSSVGAAGIWQFMPHTAKVYMRVNRVIDERRDPIIATRGAARYLLMAYNRIGNWPLALTSYNHGIAGVMRKMQQKGTSDISAIIEDHDDQVFGFASNNFFPEFLAAIEVYDQYKKYFPEIELESALRIQEVPLDKPMSLAYAAKQVGAPIDALIEANYALSSSVVSGKVKIPAGYVLKVPREYALRAGSLRVPEPRVQEIAPPSSAVHGGTVYKVRKGDTLASIARRFNVTVASIKETNSLTTNSVSVGRVLKIESEERARTEAKSAPAKQELKSEPAQTSSSGADDNGKYTVKAGDTLFYVARKFNTTVERLREANNLSSSQVSIGQELTIPERGEEPHATQKKKTSTKNAGSSNKNSSRYTVRSGENIWTISRKLKVKREDLLKANHLSSDKLKPGQTLVVPR